MSALPHVPFRQFGESNWGRTYAADEKPSLAEIQTGVAMRMAESLERIEKLLKQGAPLDPQATHRLFADHVWSAVREQGGDEFPPPGWHPTSWHGFMRRLEAAVGWAMAEQWWSSGMTAPPERDAIKRLMKNFVAVVDGLPVAVKNRVASGAAHWHLETNGPAWAKKALIG